MLNNWILNLEVQLLDCFKSYYKSLVVTLGSNSFSEAETLDKNNTNVE